MKIIVVRFASTTLSSRSEPRLFLAILALAFSASALADDQTASPNDQLWKLAEQAYGSGKYESGHIQLKTLMDKKAGDLDLALKCLEKISFEAGRRNSEDHWTQYAARRLCALECQSRFLKKAP